MNTPSNLKLGLALCGFLALTDIAGLAGTGVDDAPPLAIIVIGALIGTATLVALRPAWRQVPGGLWAVIGTRVASALFSMPPFFIDTPTYVRVGCAVAIALAVLGVGLVLPYARRARPAEVSTT